MTSGDDNQIPDTSLLALPDPDLHDAKAPDLVSIHLQRRALLWLMTILGGLGIGAMTLRLAGDKGAIGWLAVATIGSTFVALLTTAYYQRKINTLMGWMIVGFLAVCWIAIGTPSVAEGESGGGSKSLLISQVGLILLLFVWGVEIFLRQRVDLIKNPINLPIALYLFFCIVSTVSGILFPNQAVLANGPKMVIQVNILENVMRILALGGLLMIGNKLKGKTLIAGAIAIVVPGIITYTGVIPLAASKLFLVFPQVISMSILAAFTLSDIPWMKPWMRFIAGAIALSILGTYFLKGTEWVSGWASALLSLAIICWYIQRRLLWFGVAAIVLIIASNPVYFYKTIYAENFYGKYLKAASQREHHGTFDNDRIRMMRAAVLYAYHFPFGIGLGNYRSYNKYFGQTSVWDTTTFTSAHGTYSQALTETGWPGLLSLLAIIYGSCRMMRQYYIRLPNKSWAKMYVLGGYGACIGTFFASIIGDYIFPTYHNGGLTSFGNCVYTWFVIGITIAIGQEYGLKWEEIAEKRLNLAALPQPIWQREIEA